MHVDEPVDVGVSVGTGPGGPQFRQGVRAEGRKHQESAAVQHAPELAEDPVEIRRERIASPLLRDERPEVVIRQLDQIIGERLERNARSAKRP